MPNEIHPTAIIHPGAKLGEDCQIGPYCVIGSNVILGNQCRLHSHVVIDGYTTMGADNEVFPFACLGLKTQDLKWKGGITRVEIGDHNVFREYTTVHSATSDGGVTRVGSHNHFLAYVHLAHDVNVGNHIVMSNVGTLAGHVTVEDHAIIGGLAAVHQFCRIGRYSMIGGCSKVVQDVAPFMIADGNPAETRFVNKVGLERAGYSAETIAILVKAYKVLFREGLTVANAVAALEHDYPGHPEIEALMAFAKGSERGLTKGPRD
ncbi:MAG TPA: acyl-ACP--UDP-N-acetylglucosamine O-acyltransferase [Candidatus Limnocylindria bacterium]|jgi:UDP-N-acetylglucosamine acyltransferase|nr:acyl-ACP--UDP-N-acetylglucosamine O-acyltransferase [Candidatus Limnocylindria bacterium]